MNSVKIVVARFLESDLNPPLGYPGGSCYFQERVDEEVKSDSLVNRIVEKHLQNQKLAPQEENAVYRDMYPEGKVKGTFFELYLTSHAQYRMDLRGITVSEVKSSLREFHKGWAKAESRGGSNYYTELLMGRDVRWKSTSPRLELFFTVLRLIPKDKARGQKMEVRVRIDSVFFPGESPEPPVPPSSCDTWKNWEGWSQEYEDHGLDRILPKIKSADLMPPLGYPGGPCHTMERVHEEVKNPKLRDKLVDKLEEGKSLSNSEAHKIYKSPPGRSWNSVQTAERHCYILPCSVPHGPEGMTTSEIRLALKQFVKAFYDEKSQKSADFMGWSTAMAYGEPIRWVAKVPKGLTVIFQVKSGKAHIITVYWENDQDPRPRSEESCGYPSAGRVAAGMGDCYEANGKYFMDEALFPGNDKTLRLVHGEVTGQGPLAGVNYGHAWVEDGNTVIDVSNGKTVRMPKAVYYALGGIDHNDNLHEYSAREFRSKITGSGHWGPWDLRTSTGL